VVVIPRLHACTWRVNTIDASACCAVLYPYAIIGPMIVCCTAERPSTDSFMSPIGLNGTTPSLTAYVLGFPELSVTVRLRSNEPNVRK
jgi:hypothetical protein